MNISLWLNLTPHPAMYYVHVLKDNATDELYYGYTNNLKRRITEHNKKRLQRLIYYEAYQQQLDAPNRERQLKHHAQALTALKKRLKQSLK